MRRMLGQRFGDIKQAQKDMVLSTVSTICSTIKISNIVEELDKSLYLKKLQFQRRMIKIYRKFCVKNKVRFISMYSPRPSQSDRLRLMQIQLSYGKHRKKAHSLIMLLLLARVNID